MNQESMVEIKGYEGQYAITKDGRIFSYPRKGRGGHDGKWMKLQKGTDGYMHVVLTKNKIKTNYLVHRLLGFAFLTTQPQKDFINHKNGIKTDNRIENIEWCTKSENTHHAFATGLLKPCIHSEKTKIKLSLINKNKKLTKEHKDNISQNNKKSKQVTNGEVIYRSASLASKSMGFNPSAVSHAIARNRKCGGFVWTYTK